MVLGVGFAGAVFTTVLARASTPAAGLPPAVKASLLAAAVLAAIGTVLSSLRSAELPGSGASVTTAEAQ
jgi:hypothetical protein